MQPHRLLERTFVRQQGTTKPVMYDLHMLRVFVQYVRLVLYSVTRYSAVSCTTVLNVQVLVYHRTTVYSTVAWTTKPQGFSSP